MKPVAWMSPDGKVSTTEGKLFYIPLYTAPKELSDDEIMELAEYHGINDWLYETSVTDFARAILKKASEK
jgi:hypothetical protein